MDLKAPDIIFERLKEFNSRFTDNYGNVVCDYVPDNPTFPITIFSLVTNTQNPQFRSYVDRVASVSFMIDIYAKNKGKKVTKKQVANRIAEIVDEYMSNIGLLRVTFTPDNIVDDNSQYRITMVYQGNLHENSRTFI